MAKINSKALDPQRYACIQAEQRELEQQYSTHITMARLCPYCKLRLETLCKGAHGATYLKCPQCGVPHLSVHMSDNRGNVIGRGSSVINDKISVNGRNFRVQKKILR